MAVSPRFDEVLALGRKIVEELRRDDSVDTLGRWMAHYIADLISKAESGHGDTQDAARQACRDAILQLWAHRHVFPNGKRPFENCEPILRALASLDPEDDTPRYFVRFPHQMSEPRSETDKWLALASSIDSGAQMLTYFCLSTAANLALDDQSEWVALVKQLDLDQDQELQVIIRLSEDSPKEETPEERDLKKIAERIEKLKAFVALAQEFVLKLEKQRGTKAG